MNREALRFVPLSPAYDAAVADLIRRNLEAVGLNIPGTAYADPGLDRLSACFEGPGRAYCVLLENDAVIGGAGFAECAGFPDCCELQKLYLCDRAKGKGLGRALLEHAEDGARAAGYRRIYLETHSVLRAAVRLYEKTGYREIPRPAWIVHSAMDRFFIKELADNRGLIRGIPSFPRGSLRAEGGLIGGPGEKPGRGFRVLCPACFMLYPDPPTGRCPRIRGGSGQCHPKSVFFRGRAPIPRPTDGCPSD